MNAGDSEKQSQWHNRCVKKFFGTAALPEINISSEQLMDIVSISVNKGLTVPGVQKKLSLHLSKEKPARLTIVDYPTGYILKPQSPDYESLPEYEQLTMHLADLVGIKTVPHALLPLPDSLSYITRRVDRSFDGDAFQMYAMEDFCQLSGRLTADKYKGSYENCARVLTRYTTQPGLDLSEFFLRIVFCFITGNSDMHLKNFSLRENSPASRQFSLSPAYDLLPVNLILPSDKDETALTLNGKKRNLHRGDFLKFAATIHYSEKAAGKIIGDLLSKEDLLLNACAVPYLTDAQQEQMRTLIKDRMQALR